VEKHKKKCWIKI